MIIERKTQKLPLGLEERVTFHLVGDSLLVTSEAVMSGDVLDCKTGRVYSDVPWTEARIRLALKEGAL